MLGIVAAAMYIFHAKDVEVLRLKLAQCQANPTEKNRTELLLLIARLRVTYNDGVDQLIGVARAAQHLPMAAQQSTEIDIRRYAPLSI